MRLHPPGMSETTGWRELVDFDSWPLRLEIERHTVILTRSDDPSLDDVEAVVNRRRSTQMVLPNRRLYRGTRAEISKRVKFF